jgi:hypothetical protein
LKSLGLRSPRLKLGVEKFGVEKSGVEKSGVGMSCNPIQALIGMDLIGTAWSAWLEQ